MAGATATVSKATCFTLEYFAVKSAMIFAVVGLANVCVSRTTSFPVAANAANFAPTWVCKSSQLTSSPLAFGPCKRCVSYIESTDACTRAFAPPRAGASVLLSTLIGRPSLVFIKILAKSKPSAIAVA